MTFLQPDYGSLQYIALGGGQIWPTPASLKPFLDSRPVNAFSHGELQRDFVFVDDITEGIVRILGIRATHEAGAPHAPHRIFNIGNSDPIALSIFIETLEKVLEREAINNILPMQQGDVNAPHADTAGLHEWVGCMPTPPKESIANFVDWCQSRYSPANLNNRAN